MSQKADMLKASVPMEKGQSTVRRMIPILTIGLAVVLLVVPVALAMPQSNGDARHITNPELIIAERYAFPVVGHEGTALLTADPELAAVRGNLVVAQR